MEPRLKLNQKAVVERLQKQQQHQFHLKVEAAEVNQTKSTTRMTMAITMTKMIHDVHQTNDAVAAVDGYPLELAMTQQRKMQTMLMSEVDEPAEVFDSGTLMKTISNAVVVQDVADVVVQVVHEAT